MNRVIVRVDASVQMGVGHLTRCVTLANVLAGNGTRSCFLMRGHAVGLAAFVEGNGHTVRLLQDPAATGSEKRNSGLSYADWLPTTWQQDAEQTAQAMDEIGPADWLIVDHYALGVDWERACRRDGLRILAIDDLADRAHDCDALLDQNLVANMDTRYQGRVGTGCAQLLGPAYALLRPDFAAQRRLLTPRTGEIGRLLVCFGGADPTNETAKTIGAIRSLGTLALSVDIVIGAANPNSESVARLCRELAGAELHRGANNIAELMRRADLAIGAGGVMSWERCCLGLPTIAVDIAANQVGSLTALAEAGAALYLGSAPTVGEWALAGSIQAFLDDPARTRVMGEAAFALVDGGGSHRVATRLVSMRHGTLGQE